MAIRFQDSKERYASEILRGGGEESVRITRSTIQFWVQLVVLILTISAWGWSIRTDVAVLTARQQIQRDEIDRLTKETRMLQLDVKSLQLALAAKGVVVKGEVE